MSQTRQEVSLNDNTSFFGSMSFTSLLPPLYLVMLTGVFCWFSAPKVQTVFFVVAWSVAAFSILRIQKLIEHYSNGKIPYRSGVCALLLALVVMGPWLWLYAMNFLYHCLVSHHLVSKSQASWISIFTLGATLISLMAVSPMIENWYAILRGSFAFDGTRIKTFKPSFRAQVLLFALFGGVLLAPMIMARSHATGALDRGDTNYILTGLCATYIALVWLVHQLDRIREVQVSFHTHPGAPVDGAILKKARPLGSNLKPSPGPRLVAPAPPKVKNAPARRPPPASYTAALAQAPGSENAPTDG